MKRSRFSFILLVLHVSIYASSITGRLQGFIKYASNSAPVSGAQVSLFTSSYNSQLNTTTDNLGHYVFENVDTGSGYSILASFSGYINTGIGGITISENRTVNVQTLFLIRNAGTLSGTVHSIDTGFQVLPDAKVVVLLGNTVVDSTTTGSDGTFNFALTPGNYVVNVSEPGFKDFNGNKVEVLNVTVNFDSTTTLNPLLMFAQSSIVGKITQGSLNGTPVKGAKISLDHFVDDYGFTADTTTSDSNGNYQFTGLFAYDLQPNNGWPSGQGGYAVRVATSGYNSFYGPFLYLSVGITDTANIVLTRNTSTISGRVYRADSTAKVIKGAKIVFYSNNSKVDSVMSDSLGNFKDSTLGGATYTVKASITGYKSILGSPTQDTSIVVSLGSDVNISLYLSPATSLIIGRVWVFYILAKVAATGSSSPSFSAKVILQRRPTSTGKWLTLDSATTDSTFRFSSLIAATGGTSGGDYRTVSTGMGSYPPYSSNDSVNILNVKAGDSLTVQIGFGGGSGVQPFNLNASQSQRFTKLGDQIILHLNSVSISRSIDIFGMNGVLQKIIPIPPNESKVVIPGAYSPEKGFVFIIRN